METTLTSKGQLTLPKRIRDQLGLAAGARLDFTLLPDRTMRVRLVETDPLAIAGVLPPPARRGVADADLQAAVRQRGPERFAKGR